MLHHFAGGEKNIQTVSSSSSSLQAWLLLGLPGHGLGLRLGALQLQNLLQKPEASFFDQQGAVLVSCRWKEERFMKKKEKKQLQLSFLRRSADSR